MSGRMPAAAKLEGTVVATCKGQTLERIEFRHRSTIVLSGFPWRLRHARYRHRHRALLSSVRRGRFQFVQAIWHEKRGHLNPVMANGQYRGISAVVGGMNLWKAQPEIVSHRVRVVCFSRPTSSTRTRIAGATRRRRCIARLRNGSSAWT